MSEPPFYRVQDLAERWACHPDTVRIGGAVRVPHDAVMAYEGRQLMPAKHDHPEPDPSSKEAVERFRQDLRIQRAVDRYRSG